jgi:hypothetical protein
LLTDDASHTPSSRAQAQATIDRVMRLYLVKSRWLEVDEEEVLVISKSRYVSQSVILGLTDDAPSVCTICWSWCTICWSHRYIADRLSSAHTVVKMYRHYGNAQRAQGQQQQQQGQGQSVVLLWPETCALRGKESKHPLYLEQ